MLVTAAAAADVMVVMLLLPSPADLQVFLSHRPLTFYTTLLLACALCIHSILEGIALGAQESMEVRCGGRQQRDPPNSSSSSMHCCPGQLPPRSCYLTSSLISLLIRD
jgi:hypothetical protein